jgi:O-antigen/teichoic acid export membrane protein
MAGLAGRAAMVSIARFCNQGLALIGPIILVRLLSVHEFGEYRSFYLYVNIVTALAALAVNPTLLYFVPRQPESTWRIVRKSVGMVAATSLTTALLVYGAHWVSGGQLLDERVNWIVLYVLLYVNVDFWEHLALARKKALAMLGYTISRLAVRMTTAIVVAALTRDAGTIIAALTIVEAVRLVISTAVWRKLADEKSEQPWRLSTREMLAQSLPVGLSVLIVTLNQQVGGIIVERIQGEAALAYFAIGGYVYLVVAVLRNSVSDVLLPEMVAEVRGSSILDLWRRSTVIFSIMLLPIAILLACFAEPVVTTVFSAKYAAAVPVFQVYLILLLRESFDFDLALRAAGKPHVALQANVLALIVNIALALVLVPRIGLIGGAIALVTCRIAGAAYLALRVARISTTRIAQLLPWGCLARVVAAAALAAVALIPAVANPQYGWLAIIPASCVFALLFLVLLRAMNIAEIHWLAAALSRRLRMS